MKVKESVSFDRSAKPDQKVQHGQLLLILKPLIMCCRLFGVVPFQVVNNQVNLVLNKNSWWYKYSMIVLTLYTFYTGFHLVSLVISILSGYKIVDIVGQSLWLSATPITYYLLLGVKFSSQSISKIFFEWNKLERIENLYCHNKLSKRFEILYRLYAILACASILSCGVHAFRKPFVPTYPLHYFHSALNSTIGESTGIRTFLPSIQIVITLYTIFQMWMIGCLWAGFAILEVTVCIFAEVFIQYMESVISRLESTFFRESKELGMGEYVAANHIMIVNPKSPVDFGVDNAKTLSPICQQLTEWEKNVEILLGCIKNIDKIAELQAKINCTFGPILLINFAQLIGMVCALLFLPIKFAQDFDVDSLIVFGGNAICFLGRLILLVICLGNVYRAGVSVNMEFAKVTSVLKDCCVVNTILAHLSVYSTNPICFTAWDFFPITRGTLLGAFSLITTYLVLFLQSNG